MSNRPYDRQPATACAVSWLDAHDRKRSTVQILAGADSKRTHVVLGIRLDGSATVRLEWHAPEGRAHRVAQLDGPAMAAVGDLCRRHLPAACLFCDTPAGDCDVFVKAAGGGGMCGECVPIVREAVAAAEDDAEAEGG